MSQKIVNKTKVVSMYKRLRIFILFYGLMLSVLLSVEQTELSYRKSGHFTFQSDGSCDSSHSSSLYRAKSMMERNKIRTTFYNYGLVGCQMDNPEDIGGEWPINSTHEYIGDFGILIGSEIIDENGNLKHSVVTIFSPRGSEMSGDTHWGWEPRGGYANPDTNLAAISTDMNTWPTEWNNLWLGEYDVYDLTSSQEAFFVMDDAADEEFFYYPCPSDSSRRGLGLVVASHYKQWDDIAFEDALYMEYSILNESDKDLNKVVFGSVVVLLVETETHKMIMQIMTL